MLDFPERRLLLRAFVSAVVGLSLIAWNILGIDHKSEQASNNVFLHVVAPFLGARMAPDPVTVVLVTPHAIDRLNRKTNGQIWSWPFTFAQQAKLLDAIAADAPRAIFYDVAFYQNRGLTGLGYVSPASDGTKAFTDSIRDADGIGTANANAGCVDADAASTAGIPVFLSLVPGPAVVPALCQAGAQGVRVDWKAAYNAYPLDNAPVTDSADPKIVAAASQFTTPAARLYIEVCGHARRPAKETAIPCPDSPPFAWQGTHPLGDAAPLAVAWGMGVDPRQSDFADIAACEIDAGRGVFTRFVQAIGALFDDLWAHGEGIKTRCFNTRFVPIDQLLLPLDKTNLKDALQGHVVMIGTDLPGINDTVYSPAQGQVPGVFMHAAALENLLHWGHGYFRDVEESGRDWWLLQIASCLVVTAMIYGSVRAIEWFRRNPPSLPLLAYSFRGPSRGLVKDAVVDLLQLLALAAAIVAILLLLTLIAFFWFGIAPLNWVGMAALILGLTLDEIGGTAADALVVLAMTLSTARRIARTFFPHPSLE